ncbi:putative MFS family arabinose efflux permease [Mumia flava]|uniref:Putative MFS family arabinose efflux permease n=1 Tax=Mumia flava TaxID=1348852 RepID=A0A0B2B933_9ACTN|nr:MFS transporter [Mumia flava]PJJ53444.1 putative MFS family arabinose efflux permease [Mumia flava]
MSRNTDFEDEIFTALADGVDDGVADDDGGLSEYALEREAASFTRHVGSLSATKVADGLLDPKLVLSWLLSHLGASSFFTGLLVPLREAGSLLPQLVIAPRVHALARRKWAWAAGSLVQGLACAGIVVAALTLEGNAAGIAVCVLLTILAAARAACSVSHKDVLRKTVGKTRRGSSTGFASSAASVGVIVFAVLLMIGAPSRYVLVVGALTLASVLWIGAAALFATIPEEASHSETDRAVWSQLSLLREDPQLRLFIVVRGLLTATALAPPYLVLLASSGARDSLDQLGALVLASALASLVSSYVWGRLSDRSSRAVLQRSGIAAAVALGAALGLAAAGLADTLWAMPVALFVLMIAYEGVRQGRSTYLVDMAPADQTPAYTAVANTVIGVVLLASGLFGALASLAGVEVTVALFALMSLGAAVAAIRLREVEHRR